MHTEHPDKRGEARPPHPAERPATPPPGLPRFDSRQLFSGGNEVEIEHVGAIYRLRRTALGKLILTK